MKPEWIEWRSPAFNRTRCRRPTLSTRTITSPSVRSAIGSPTPPLRRCAPPPHEWGGASSPTRFVCSDQGVPVRVPQLSLPPLRVQLDPGLPLRRLDHLCQLGGKLRSDAHVAHPVLVAPVELARLCGLDLEAGSLQLRHPLLQREREDVRRVAADLNLMQHVAGRERRSAVHERRIPPRFQDPKGFG